MRRIGAVAVFWLLTSCGAAEGATAEVAVSGAWARPTPSVSTVGAVYLTLRADADDALVGVAVETSVAVDSMIHETSTDDGQTTMAHSSSVELPAGEAVVFEPGGYHVMLTDLSAPLASGASFDLKLDFERAASQTVRVTVRDEEP